MPPAIPALAQKGPWTPPPFIGLTTNDEEDGDTEN
jgi:hypothetical protein